MRDVKRAVLGALATLPLLAGAALAQPAAPTYGAPTSSAPTSASDDTARCAATYHRALEPVRRDLVPALADIHRKLRAADPAMPGQWLFAATLFAKPKTGPQPKPQRICVETADVRGQQRCVRFEVKPPPPPPAQITTKAAPAGEDLRLLRALNDVVVSKGALPDVGNNGKYNFTVQRVAQDLRVYATQPEAPTLCAGVSDMLDFYSAQMAPLKKRAEDAAQTIARLKELTAIRTRDIGLAEQRVYERTVAEAKAKADADAARVARASDAPTASSPSTPATPAAAPSLPPRPADVASEADYKLIGFAGLVAEALRALLPAAIANDVVAEPEPLKMLARAREAILDPARADDKVAVEVRDAAYAALRLLEARIYAETLVRRFAELDSVVPVAIKDIRGAAAANCTCRD